MRLEGLAMDKKKLLEIVKFDYESHPVYPLLSGILKLSFENVGVLAVSEDKSHLIELQESKSGVFLAIEEVRKGEFKVMLNIPIS